MAEIVLAPLLQVVFDKIADPVLQEFSDYFELDDRFKKLQRILPMAQAVIQDAEERQATDKAVRIWLSELKDAACRVEDLIEEFTYRQKGLKLPLAERNVVGRKFDTRETSSFVVGSEVCGGARREGKFFEMLLESSGERSCVVSIVGSPGIGKSTLAQMVYNDDEVKRGFDLRIWVYVSPDFKVKRIYQSSN
ncbi:putative disease resistance protein RGA1 [Sesamum alatum]|uniref:Disease resistance protein RGA1 n=1 Tax=Sesamum alatum TaxID=300844 RepID=A0AAE2CXU1_9LAMI|nr:putative disease resistance protein RGA1 [Sesamum alatum]